MGIVGRIDVAVKGLPERGLTARTPRGDPAQWLVRNRRALDAWNKRIEREGIWSDGLRGF